MNTDGPPDKLSIVVYDHHFDKVHYALVTASAAVAIGKAVTLFFTMGACQALMTADASRPHGWATMALSDGPGDGQERNQFYQENGVATFEELIEACSTLGVTFMVCEMGLRAKKLEGSGLRKDLGIEISGMVTFLNDASKNGAMLFI